MQEDIDAPARKRAHNLAHDLVSKLTQSILLGQMVPGDKPVSYTHLTLPTTPYV